MFDKSEFSKLFWGCSFDAATDDAAGFCDLGRARQQVEKAKLFSPKRVRAKTEPKRVTISTKARSFPIFFRKTKKMGRRRLQYFLHF